MDFKGRSELHGVIASQGMRSRQYRSLGDQRGGNRDDDVLAGKIELEIRHGDRGVVGRDRAATLPPRHGGDSFSQRDPHHDERMPGDRCGQGLHPSSAGFLDVSLENRDGVEEEGRHRSRRSRMAVSEIGSPRMGTARRFR